MNCHSSIMAADSTPDNVAEMSSCSKIDHFYSCGWNSAIVGNETEFAHPQCSVFLGNQINSGCVEIMPKISSVGNEVSSEIVSSNGGMDESGYHSDFHQDQPHAKRKRNVSSCKNRNGNPNSKQTDEDIVHLRAKRGQATSSQSLAERMRRERISERMRMLQDLVPGCDKITGKAVMLDEIISYVQSLQQQVEFLSMKLASANREVNMDMEQILSTDNSWNNEVQRILRGSNEEDEYCYY